MRPIADSSGSSSARRGERGWTHCLCLSRSWHEEHVAAACLCASAAEAAVGGQAGDHRDDGPRSPRAFASGGSDPNLSGRAVFGSAFALVFVLAFARGCHAGWCGASSARGRGRPGVGLLQPAGTMSVAAPRPRIVTCDAGRRASLGSGSVSERVESLPRSHRDYGWSMSRSGAAGSPYGASGRRGRP